MELKPAIEHLKISDSWVLSPKIYRDSRGFFFEWFKDSIFQSETSSSFNLAQSNCSISNKGVIRGIHFAQVPPGQAKYVTCFTGSVFDVVVDLRKNSPTFGKWDSVILNSQDPKVLYIPSGCGHAFMSLEDKTTFVYLCDQKYNPDKEYEINPFDPTINIQWPKNLEIILSEKDKNAPFLNQVLDLLPD